LLVPRFHRLLCIRFSALCLNLQFRREISDAIERSMRRWEILTLLSWIALAAFLVEAHVAVRCLATWYAASACAAAINMVRTLGAHRYASEGQPLERDEQLLDSIDTPGAFWTELWAPVGLRYHAMHHYFPGIPYHNLGEAHRRLTDSLPADSIYQRSVSPGLPTSIGTLWRGRAS
jgi:fatty acid desaturase